MAHYIAANLFYIFRKRLGLHRFSSAKIFRPIVSTKPFLQVSPRIMHTLLIGHSGHETNLNRPCHLNNWIVIMSWFYEHLQYWIQPPFACTHELYWSLSIDKSLTETLPIKVFEDDFFLLLALISQFELVFRLVEFLHVLRYNHWALRFRKKHFFDIFLCCSFIGFPL